MKWPYFTYNHSITDTLLNLQSVFVTVHKSFVERPQRLGLRLFLWVLWSNKSDCNISNLYFPLRKKRRFPFGNEIPTFFQVPLSE